MNAISLPDRLYIEAQRAATASGLSVETFVAQAVSLHLQDDPQNFDHRFTPEVVASLDRAAAQADLGPVMTFEQYELEFQPKRDAWLKERANSL